MYFYPFILFTDCFLFKIIRIISREYDYFSSSKLEYMGTYPLEKISIMRHHKQGDTLVFEVSFKPFYHIQIQMISRLIENKHLRISHQSLSQRDTFFFSSRQRSNSLIKIWFNTKFIDSDI